MHLSACHRWLVKLALGLVLCHFSSVHADSGALELWRQRVAAVRALTENDTPAAYREVLQLQKTLPVEAMPVDRIALLNLLARIENFQANTGQAETHAHQAYAQAEQNGDRAGRIEADLNLGLSTILQGRIEAMNRAVFDGMTLIAGVENPELVCEMLLRAAMAHKRKGNIDDAITTAMQAMEIANRSENPLALLYANHGMAVSYMAGNQIEQARDHYLQMRELARKAHSRRLEAEALVGLANATTQLGNWPEGERMLRESVAMLREVGQPFNLASSQYGLAENLWRQGRIEEALVQIDGVIAIYNRYPNKIAYWWALDAHSNYQLALGRLDAALAEADKAYRLAVEIDFPLYIAGSARRLAAVHAARGNHKQAYAFAVEASESAADADAHQAAERMRDLAQRYEADNKKRHLDALAQRNRAQAQELASRQHSQRLLRMALVGALVAVGVFVLLLLRLRRSHRLLQRESAERARIDAVLADSERQYRSLVEHTPDSITRYDRHCRRIYVNPRVVAETGLLPGKLIGKTPTEVPGGEAAVALEEKLRDVLASGRPEMLEVNIVMADNSPVVSAISLTPELDGRGKVVSVLAVGRDITEIDAYRQSVHRMAFFDTLTNLPNRALLNDRINQAIADASWHGYNIGLMLLDLDRFKEINDTLGHGVGDQVLHEAAQRLSGCVRGYDTVARLGGDEFAALLPEVHNSTDLATIAGKMIDVFSHPFLIDGRELFVSTSIGIAVYPDDSVDVDTLFRYADSAMYHAKQQGRNNFQFYSAELTEKTAGRMNIENDLRRAMERNELQLYYQPQVNLGSGKTIGAEALLRWDRGAAGMVTPDKFIPVAEETGLIVGIGEWVLESACRTAAAWNARRPEPLRIAVNLSTRQFIRNDLVGTVQRILEKTACKPEWIKLEITESLLLGDGKEIVDALAAFDTMGLAISIDDFGTGYSALSYLNRFPVSQIKIDRSFVNGIPADRNKAELVKAMISIAKSLRLDLVAEGVETASQANYLLAHGCMTAQGYLFGKPMPQGEFENMVNSSFITEFLEDYSI